LIYHVCCLSYFVVIAVAFSVSVNSEIQLCHLIIISFTSDDYSYDNEGNLVDDDDNNVSDEHSYGDEDDGNLIDGKTATLLQINIQTAVTKTTT